MLMASKHHCIICSDLIFSGLYCSSCYREITRARTMDDEPLEAWINRSRSRIGLLSETGELKPLDLF